MRYRKWRDEELHNYTPYQEYLSNPRVYSNGVTLGRGCGKSVMVTHELVYNSLAEVCKVRNKYWKMLKNDRHKLYKKLRRGK